MRCRLLKGGWGSWAELRGRVDLELKSLMLLDSCYNKEEQFVGNSKGWARIYVLQCEQTAPCEGTVRGEKQKARADGSHIDPSDGQDVTVGLKTI